VPRAAVQGDAHLLQHQPLQDVRPQGVPQAPLPRRPRLRRDREEGRRAVRPRREQEGPRQHGHAAAHRPYLQDVLIKSRFLRWSSLRPDSNN
jgi:hypothetical protein